MPSFHQLVIATLNSHMISRRSNSVCYRAEESCTVLKAVLSMAKYFNAAIILTHIDLVYRVHLEKLTIT